MMYKTKQHFAQCRNCGKNHQILDLDGNQYVVWCLNCTDRPRHDSPRGSSPEEAIAAWNKRNGDKPTAEGGAE